MGAPGPSSRGHSETVSTLTVCLALWAPRRSHDHGAGWGCLCVPFPFRPFSPLQSPFESLLAVPVGLESAIPGPRPASIPKSALGWSGLIAFFSPLSSRTSRKESERGGSRREAPSSIHFHLSLPRIGLSHSAGGTAHQLPFPHLPSPNRHPGQGLQKRGNPRRLDWTQPHHLRTAELHSVIVFAAAATTLPS